MFAQRLFQTAAGPMYLEVGYDGTRGVVFDQDGRVAEAADLTPAGSEVAAIETVLRTELNLGELDSRRLADEIRVALEEEDEIEEPSAWTLAAVMLGTVGIWIVGVAAIVAGIVYLLLWLA